MEQSTYYTTRDGHKMQIKLYYPEPLVQGKNYPLVGFFFGGGWMNGNPDTFRPQSIALAKEGYIGATIDYRVYERNNVTLDVIMTDAFYALKHLSDECKALHIDPNNVFLSGGSAGGHLALCCALFNNVPHKFKLKGFPVFNPVVDTTPAGYQSDSSLLQPFAPIMFSPIHQITAAFPPILLMYGSNDTIMPAAVSAQFTKHCQSLGIDITEAVYEGRPHAFFNLNEDNIPEDYYDTLAKLIAFVKKYTS